MIRTEQHLDSPISRYEGEPNPSLFNRLSGLMRLAHFDQGLLTKQELESQFDEYTELARQQRAALFLAHVAYNRLDDAELAGFATTKVNETTKGLHVDHLFVHFTARGRRLGQHLLDATVQFAESQYAPYVRYEHLPSTATEHSMLQNSDFTPDEHGIYHRFLSGQSGILSPRLASE